MDFQNELYQVLDATSAIALATSMNGVPNVRIVNFCRDNDRPNVLYFASDRTNQKVTEFQQNNKVALTTIPADIHSIPHARSHDAFVQKSQYSIYDLADKFIQKISGYDETIAAIGETLDVFEIHINSAFVSIDFENAGSVSFNS